MTDLHQKTFFAPREQIVFFAYMLFTLLLVFFHEPWEDELQAWCIARELTVPEIFYQMRYEGHFALWYLLLKPFAFLGVSVISINLISWLLCVFSAAFFLTCRRFSFGLKILILCSCPLLYWFPVVSRNYALIPPVLCLIAGLYPHRFKHPFAYSFALILLVHSHAYMEGLAGVLGLFLVWDLLRHNVRRTFRLSLRTAGVISLLGAGVLAAFLQVFPAFGASSFAPSEFGAVFLHLESIPGKFASLLSELPAEYVSRFSFLSGCGLVAVVFWFLIVWAVIVLFRTRGRAGWFFLAGLLWQLLFAVMIYPMRMHRVYLPLLMLIFCFALPVRRRRPPRRNADRAGRIPLLLLVLLTLPAMLYYTANDMTRLFSSQQALAHYIGSNLPQNAKIVVFPPTLITGTFRAFLPDREFYSCADNRPFRIFRKQGKLPPRLDNELLEWLTGPDRSEIYLLIQTGAFLSYHHHELQMEYDFPSFTMKLMYGSPEKTFFSAGEDYLLFKVTRKTP